ncbi:MULTISPECIES: hypothetical protein [Streptomyces]|uniref:Uncharacterized protein n=3 Tax=Streptomyces violaceoruber group TaxID=2867121 RepID=A0ACD4WJC2_STRVN|nr:MULTISPECIES: hypothetical protein [Streptomyces]WOY97311.1 hypothetical protein R2E43_07610 [Streptomyces violaceoruber]BDD75684.1 hypothetical protein JCM4020_63040 [Streptomyces coelicolor]MDX3320761.1 hypothetical protein [Streptomyces sp. ME03-5684b]MDX3397811.1 hypothetical protein [Streptomyces sp. ME01-18h]PSK45841.1 hypothetical protein B0E38_07194 [Streptomyces sp. 111WW2]
MTPPAAPYVLGIDTDATTLREADHLLQALAAELDLPEGVFGCTHLVRDGRPRVALSLAAEAEPVLRTARDRLTARGHEVRDGTWDETGRAVLFPGAAALTGTLTLAELLARSAVDRVTVLGTPDEPSPDTRLVTRNHVRPHWQDGRLVLAAMPAVGGTLVPFEDPDPTPCCADH